MRVNGLRAAPITRDRAMAFVMKHHRHHGRLPGDLFRVAAFLDTELVGVAIIGRPPARLLDDGTICTVSRLCTLGTKNACSFLYSRAARIAREFGFQTIDTYVLESEPGTSLLAAGWERLYTTDGGSWDRTARRRVGVGPECPKVRWAKELNPCA